MRTHDEETHDFRIVAFEQLADGGEVAGRFRHLLVPQLNKAVVHPVFDEGLRVISIQDALGLGNFVLVMRKLQVLSAAVNVEMRPQQFRAHRRALICQPGRPSPGLCQNGSPLARFHRTKSSGSRLSSTSTRPWARRSSATLRASRSPEIPH